MKHMLIVAAFIALAGCKRDDGPKPEGPKGDKYKYSVVCENRQIEFFFYAIPENGKMKSVNLMNLNKEKHEVEFYHENLSDTLSLYTTGTNPHTGKYRITATIYKNDSVMVRKSVSEFDGVSSIAIKYPN